MIARFATICCSGRWVATVVWGERAWNGAGESRFAAVLDMCDEVAWDALQGRIPAELQDAVFTDVMDAIAAEVAS